jgi:hypothetical protein
MSFIQKGLVSGVLCVIFVSIAGASSLDILTSVKTGSQRAATNSDIYGAHQIASTEFDRAGRVKHSPPLVHQPAGSTVEKVRANLVIGTPGKRIRKEPKNPLTSDGKAKPQKSGKGLWWGAGGAVAGAGLGFLLGGPIGAAIGGVLGAVAGFFFGP